MPDIQRVYTIPLRKEFLKVPKYKRAKKSVKALREFLAKHMKSEDIYVGKFLNEAVWGKGMRNPPHHVKVNVLKNEKGKVIAELFGKEMPKLEEEEKKKKKPSKLEEKKEQLQKMMAGKAKKEEPKKEEKPAEKKEAPKEEKKPEPKKEEKKGAGAETSK